MSFNSIFILRMRAPRVFAGSAIILYIFCHIPALAHDEPETSLAAVEAAVVEVPNIAAYKEMIKRRIADASAGATTAPP